jgi:hypothetical protein
MAVGRPKEATGAVRKTNASIAINPVIDAVISPVNNGPKKYDLAQTGKHEDFAAIQLAIMREGHAESVPWLERPGIIDAINQICIISRIGNQPGAYA